MAATDPRFVNLNRQPPRPAVAPGSSASSGRVAGLNFHDPKVQLGAAAAAAVVLYALYKRKQAAAAAGTSSATGVDPTAAAGTATSAGTGSPYGYNSTASDVYNAIEPLFEQLAGVAPQQQATLAQILTQLQNNQTSQSSGATAPTPPVTVPPPGAPAGSGWGGSSPTHWFPGGPRTAAAPVPATAPSSGAWGR